MKTMKFWKKKKSNEFLIFDFRSPKLALKPSLYNELDMRWKWFNEDEKVRIFWNLIDNWNFEPFKNFGFFKKIFLAFQIWCFFPGDCPPSGILGQGAHLCLRRGIRSRQEITRRANSG